MLVVRIVEGCDFLDGMIFILVDFRLTWTVVGVTVAVAVVLVGAAVDKDVDNDATDGWILDTDGNGFCCIVVLVFILVLMLMWDDTLW